MWDSGLRPLLHSLLPQSCFSLVTMQGAIRLHFCGLLFAAQAGAFCLGHNVHALKNNSPCKKKPLVLNISFVRMEATFWRDQHVLRPSFMEGARCFYGWIFQKCHCDGVLEAVIWPSCNLWFFSKREGTTRGHTAQTLHGRGVAHWPFHLR